MYFNKVMLLFMNTFGYMENSIVGCVENNKYQKSIPQKTKIGLLYAPNDDDTPLKETASRHNFFTNLGKFSLSPEPCCTIRLLKAMLMRVENKDDLYFIKEAIQDEPMELEEDPDLKAIKIKIFLQEVELTDDKLIADFISNTGDMKILKFFYTKNKSVYEYISTEQKMYASFLENCSYVGIDPENPAYLYLRFIKFLFQSSFHYPFMSHNIHTNSLQQPLPIYINQKLNSIVYKLFQEPISLSRRSIVK